MRRVAGYIVAFRYFALFWCLGSLAKMSSQLQLRPVPFDSWGGVSCCERKLLFLAMALCPIWPWVTQNCNTFCLLTLKLVLNVSLNIANWNIPQIRTWKLCPTFKMFIRWCVDLGKHCIWCHVLNGTARFWWKSSCAPYEHLLESLQNCKCFLGTRVFRP